jgi:hypothetical protein
MTDNDFDNKEWYVDECLIDYVYDDNNKIMNNCNEICTINKVNNKEEIYNNNGTERVRCDNKLIKYDMMGGRPSIEVLINDKIVRCLLDTGAKISVINSELLNSLGRFEIMKTD